MLINIIKLLKNKLNYEIDGYKQVGPYIGLLFNGRPLALSTNYRLTATNTLAYYGTKLITTVKSFIVQAP